MQLAYLDQSAARRLAIRSLSTGVISPLTSKEVNLSTDHRVEDVRWLSEETFIVRTERKEQHVRAGQCFSLGTRDAAINREYSIYSAEQDPYLEFLIRRVEGGAVSTALAHVKQGDVIQISGPYGSFCLSEHDIGNRSYVFVASGTGIAPFASFVKTYPDLDYSLFHGVRFETETYDKDLYGSNRYSACISRPDAGDPVRVTQALQRIELSPGSLYYLCGNRNMITDTVTVLRDAGVPGGNIFMETFF